MSMPFFADAKSKYYAIQLASKVRIWPQSGTDPETTREFFGLRNAYFADWLAAAVPKIDEFLEVASKTHKLRLISFQNSYPVVDPNGGGKTVKGRAAAGPVLNLILAESPEPTGSSAKADPDDWQRDWQATIRLASANPLETDRVKWIARKVLEILETSRPAD